MNGKIMWRAEVFDNKDDKVSSRSIYIDAVDEHIAAEKAKEAMGNSMRVDLVRTIIVGPDSN